MADHSSTAGADGRTEAEEVLAADEPQAAEGDAPKDKNRLPEIPVSERVEITCREDLDRVIAAHQKWIAAVFDPNAEVAAGRANLEGADLRAYDLSGVNLSGANLARANLQGVELVRANLTVANLQGAQMQCANLRGARLTRMKIEGADLRGADLTDAVLTGVDLSKAILKSSEVEATEVTADSAAEAKVLPHGRIIEGATATSRLIEGATIHGPSDDLSEASEEPVSSEPKL